MQNLLANLDEGDLVGKNSTLSLPDLDQLQDLLENATLEGENSTLPLATDLDELQDILDNVEDEDLNSENTTLSLTELDDLHDFLENVDNEGLKEGNATLSLSEIDKLQDLINNLDDEALAGKNDSLSLSDLVGLHDVLHDLDHEDPKGENSIGDETNDVNPQESKPVGSSDDEAIAVQWKKQEWENETPQEIAEMAHAEADSMFHDKYVPLVATAIGLASLAFAVLVAQQMLENPDGKTCRCTLTCIRSLGWPITMVCHGCGCSRTHDRWTHQRLSVDDVYGRDIEFD